MENKNGFTLVEILSVVIIVAIILVIIAINSLGGFDSAKNKIEVQNINAIKEAARVLMTEVDNCDEEINADILSTGTDTLASNNGLSGVVKCDDLKNKALKQEDGTGCLNISLKYLLDNEYITGSGVWDIYEKNTNYSVVGCLDANKKIEIKFDETETTTTTGTTTTTTTTQQIPIISKPGYCSDDYKYCFTIDFNPVNISLPTSEEVWNNGEYDEERLQLLKKYFEGELDEENLKKIMIDELTFNISFDIEGEVTEFNNLKLTNVSGVIEDVNESELLLRRVPITIYWGMVSDNPKLNNFLSKIVTDSKTLNNIITDYLNKNYAYSFLYKTVSYQIVDNSAPILIVEDLNGNKKITDKYLLNSPTYNGSCLPDSEETYYIFDNASPLKKLTSYDINNLYVGPFNKINMNVQDLEEKKYIMDDISQFIKLTDSSLNSKKYLITFPSAKSNAMLNINFNHDILPAFHNASGYINSKRPLYWDITNNFLYYNGYAEYYPYYPIDYYISVTDAKENEYPYYYVYFGRTSYSNGLKTKSNSYDMIYVTGNNPLNIFAINCFGYEETDSYTIYISNYSNSNGNSSNKLPEACVGCGLQHGCLC